jgi:hypothetical protein
MVQGFGVQGSGEKLLPGSDRRRPDFPMQQEAENEEIRSWGIS